MTRIREEEEEWKHSSLKRFIIF